MGAFPSHDAPELLYTTMVTRPTTETRVEVCLVPLLPRFFNDGHKKLKKKLSDLLVRKLPQTSSTPTGVTGTNTNNNNNNNNSTTTATAASGGNGSGNASANSAKRQEQTGGTALVDYIMSCTESFFFVNTKVAVGKNDAVHEEQQKHPGKEKLGQSGSTSTPGSASGTGVEPTASQQQPQPHSGSHHTGSHHSTPSLMRPVPFAVCILEPENSTTDSNSSASNQQHSSNKHHHQAQNNNTVLIKGRRLQLVGFVSCCMDRQITHLNTSNSPKLHTLNGVGSNSGSSSSAPAGTTGAASSGDCKQQTYPVVLDVVFDDVEAHDYLTESVVLLASFAFRKQFVDSCALYFPAGDNDVEVAFDRQMERLQLRLVLRHDVYRGIRMFYSHYTLLDMIKELEMHKIPPAHFSLYENNFGEYGMEVTFSNMFLARWMRFVEKKMTVDSVNGYYVRCVTSDLQQERFRLMQERQDSGAFLEEEEDDERLFGGALLSVALKRWLVAGSQSLLHQQMQHPGGGLPVLFPGGPAAPAAAGGIPAGVGVGPAVPGGVGLGGYWPQMSMMGAPPSWPAGVVPFAPPMASVMGQPPSFVIPGGRPQIIYAAPQGGSAFVAQGGMHIVPSPAGPYGVMAPAPQQQQQIVYVLPSGQMAQATAAAPAQPQAATATAVPTTATAAAVGAAGGAPHAAYPTAAMPQVYYTAPATYAVSYQPYMYQQPPLPPPPPPPPQQQQQQAQQAQQQPQQQ